MTYKAKVAVCSEIPKKAQRKASTMYIFFNIKPSGTKINRWTLTL